MTIDVWMQYPTVRFSQHDMSVSLRRRTGRSALTEDLPIENNAAKILRRMTSVDGWCARGDLNPHALADTGT